MQIFCFTGFIQDNKVMLNIFQAKSINLHQKFAFVLTFIIIRLKFAPQDKD